MRVAPAAIFLIGYLRAIDGSNAKLPRTKKNTKPPTSPRWRPAIAKRCERPESRKACLTSSLIVPRFPVISADATPPAEPGRTAAIRRVYFSAELPQTLAPAAAALGRAGPTRGAKG